MIPGRYWIPSTLFSISITNIAFLTYLRYSENKHANRYNTLPVGGRRLITVGTLSRDY